MRKQSYIKYYEFISIEKLYIINIYQMNKILDVMEDIKQNITDNQYKIIMDSLMEIHKTNNNGNLLPVLSVNQQLNKFVSLFNWLDRKLELTESQNDRINRRDLYKYIKVNYFNCSYNTTCGFIKTLINIYFTYSEKGQTNYTYFEYVKYRN
jgi:hypothetical protein